MVWCGNNLNFKKKYKMWNFGLKKIDKHRTHSLADSHWYLAQATKLRNCKAKILTEPIASSALTRQNHFQLTLIEWRSIQKGLNAFQVMRLVDSNRLLLPIACCTQMLMVVKWERSQSGYLATSNTKLWQLCHQLVTGKTWQLHQVRWLNPFDSAALFAFPSCVLS